MRVKPSNENVKPNEKVILSVDKVTMTKQRVFVVDSENPILRRREFSHVLPKAQLPGTRSGDFDLLEAFDYCFVGLRGPRALHRRTRMHLVLPNKFPE